MKAIFIADAHLRYAKDENYRKLLDFLDQQQDLDALFLLGDIFEFWLGYRHLVFSAYVPILEKLRHFAENGTKLYFVEGNHDFNIGPYFTETLGCKVITDQDLIEWDGKKLFLSHGDLLNPSKGYQALRSFWRCAPIRLLSKVLHPDPVWAFGIWLSDISSRKKRGKSSWDPSPLIHPLISTELGKKADVILCGHFHQPLQSEVMGKQVVAVGDWIKQFSYAEMINGEISLKTYSD
ncbi:UDP-2,3-diacylglucosamine hydrolase [Malonomonas rubra DSM 5091]|uniref:UDP-2,3-diacylglucosamine hydrolase n=1 Tax=Malonomonas rubra DSM 5091 TaxID=1122189 RepID=A0A1M6BJP2_MALRU|nr:UDP-2,3-diacylglucosamine diphosphatase [Malonomonas rubra]SHI48808.1 UDP-2,3-diacylglucosamine hydrolase [Malonomonas rubra DSM 5091]